MRAKTTLARFFQERPARQTVMTWEGPRYYKLTALVPQDSSKQAKRKTKGPMSHAGS